MGEGQSLDRAAFWRLPAYLLFESWPDLCSVEKKRRESVGYETDAPPGLSSDYSSTVV